VQALNGVGSGLFLASQGFFDGTQWVVAAYTNYFGATSYTHTQGFFFPLDTSQLCSASLTSAAYTHAIQYLNVVATSASSVTTADVSYTFHPQTLSLSSLAASSSLHPCDEVFTFDPVLNDLTYNSGYSGNFIHTIATTSCSSNVTYTATLSSGASLPAWLAYSLQTFTLTNAQVGTFTIVLEAQSDVTGVSIQRSFNIEVLLENSVECAQNTGSIVINAPTLTSLYQVNDPLYESSPFTASYYDLNGYLCSDNDFVFSV